MADTEWDLLAIREQLRALEEERQIANSEPLDTADLMAIRGRVDIAPTVILSDGAVYRMLDEIADARAYQSTLGIGTAIELLAELQVARDLIEALQWMPAHTIDFTDPEGYIHEVRKQGWNPIREQHPKPPPALPPVEAIDRGALVTAVDNAEREFGGR